MTVALALTAIVGLGLAIAVAIGLSRRSPYRRKPLMTDNEREFHGRLLRAIAGRPSVALYPQVPILALLEPASGRGTHGYRNAFQAISNRRVDWVIEDGDRMTIVELDDRTHDPAKDRRRDAILTGCGYRVLRYPSRAKPSPTELRRDLLDDTLH